MKSYHLRALVAKGVDWVLPRRCLLCGEVVASEGFCSGCWPQLSFLREPCCVCCGYPLPQSSLCLACRAHTPHYDRARSLVAYNEVTRGLILALKRQGRTEGVGLYGRWMRETALKMCPPLTLMAPVPLHWRRLVARRYNQSALLMKGMLPLPSGCCVFDLLQRTRSTPSQGLRTLRKRYRNVRGAFRVHKRHTSLVRGATVLLVDDVMTTGATLGACALALKREGARWVGAVTLARTLQEGDHL